MADTTQQPESKNSHPPIVDTNLRANRENLFVMIFMGGVLFIPTMIYLKLNVPIFDNPYMINLIGGGCAFVTIIISKRIMTPLIKSSINTFLSENDNLSIEEQIIKLFSSIRPIMLFTCLKEFAKILVDRKHTGITIRNCPEKDIATIHPYNVTFEPLLLDEADETITELEQSSNADNSNKNYDFPDKDSYSTGMITPRLNRNIRMAGGWGVFILIVISALMIIVGTLMSGQSIELAIFMSICLLIVIFGIQAGSTLGRRQWLIIPGGLIVREGKYFSQDCRLHMFDRRKSVLIANKFDKHKWTIIAANENTCQYCIATRKESEILLRAWLSPLSPPPIEQLSDLM